MSLMPYAQYHESGVPWLNLIPTTWSVKQSRRTFALRSGRATAGDTQLTASQKYGIIGQADFMKLEGQRVVQVIKGADILKRVECGDFVISMRSFQGGIEYSNVSGAISSAYVVLVPNVELEAGYFRYLFKSSLYIQALQTTSNLVRDGQALRYENFTQVPLPMPPLPDQAAIADFLDRETAKIDTLITEQERLMDLLMEKRQAVISHAVTKGLNPDAPMKESGVEWLGEVPAHWDVMAIKRQSVVQRGASPRPIDDTKYFDDEGKYAWVRIADVSSSDGFLISTTQRLSDLGSSLSVKIHAGELFVSIAGTVGKPCISMIDACIHDGFVYFPTLKIDPKYFFRVFEAGTCYGGLGKLGTQLNLNTDTIGAIKVAIPPADELAAILDHLSVKISLLDDLVSNVKQAVSLLSERRTALISAAVTGQIDVRHLANADAA